MSTNHDLARSAAEKCKAYKPDDWAAVIADTYAAPMAELERLNRQVKLATESTNVCYYEMGDYYLTAQRGGVMFEDLDKILAFIGCLWFVGGIALGALLVAIAWRFLA